MRTRNMGAGRLYALGWLGAAVYVMPPTICQPFREAGGTRKTPVADRRLRKQGDIFLLPCDQYHDYYFCTNFWYQQCDSAGRDGTMPEHAPRWAAAAQTYLCAELAPGLRTPQFHPNCRACIKLDCILGCFHLQRRRRMLEPRTPHDPSRTLTAAPNASNICSRTASSPRPKRYRTGQCQA